MSRFFFLFCLLVAIIFASQNKGPNPDGYKEHTNAEVKVEKGSDEPVMAISPPPRELPKAKPVDNKWLPSEFSVASPHEHISLIPTNRYELVEASIMMIPTLLVYAYLYYAFFQ